MKVIMAALVVHMQFSVIEVSNFSVIPAAY